MNEWIIESSLSVFSAPLSCWLKAPKTLWASVWLITNIPNSLTLSRWDLQLPSSCPLPAYFIHVQVDLNRFDLLCERFSSLLVSCFQAKTVEEKKLWAHHIKRIILENHHAIIPQKVRSQYNQCTHQCTHQYPHQHQSVWRLLFCVSGEGGHLGDEFHLWVNVCLFVLKTVKMKILDVHQLEKENRKQFHCLQKVHLKCLYL